MSYEAAFGRRFRPFQGRGFQLGGGDGGSGDGGSEQLQQQQRQAAHAAAAPAARGGGGGGGANIHDLRSAAAAPSALPEGQRDSAFLSRLPQVVLRNGNVVDVRGEIAEMLRNGVRGP